METHELVPHPAFAPFAVRRVRAGVVAHDARWLVLRWRIEGTEALVIPPLAGEGRADGLWRETCFEMFLWPAGKPGYAEFNLSPSERWAAYDFTARREGMAERPVSPMPVLSWRPGRAFSLFDAAIPASALPPLPAGFSLTAVLEEDGGRKSYWAVHHPGAAPDFHDPACAAGMLAAPLVP